MKETIIEAIPAGNTTPVLIKVEELKPNYFVARVALKAIGATVEDAVYSLMICVNELDRGEIDDKYFDFDEDTPPPPPGPAMRKVRDCKEINEKDSK